MEKSKTTQWFVDNVIDDIDELKEIGDLANKMMLDRLSISLTNNMQPIALYGIIFSTICDIVAARENEYSEFAVNIADRLRIGYTTTDSEDDEKNGNFMVFIQHISNPKNESLDEEESSSIALCSQWNADNIKVQSELMKEIAIKAKRALGDYINIKIESHEFIIPMFCIIHSAIMNYIALKRADNNVDEYELNIAGLYTVGCCMTEEGDVDFYFIPSISLKLKFKNDLIATGRDED